MTKNQRLAHAIQSIVRDTQGAQPPSPKPGAPVSARIAGVFVELSVDPHGRFETFYLANGKSIRRGGYSSPAAALAAAGAQIRLDRERLARLVERRTRPWARRP